MSASTTENHPKATSAAGLMEQIYFVLTERCNLSCSHCIRESSPQRNETAELDMMVSALNEIATLYPQATILLSGGEPTIYKHFIPLLEHAIGLKLDIIVNSNGATSFFTPHKLEQLQRYEKLAFQISLDGVEEAHDLIRGQGMFRKSLRAIGNLRAQGIKCTVSATVMNKNFFSSIAKFIADLDGLGLRHIAIKRVTYAGRAANGSELDTPTWNENVRRVRQMVTTTPMIINPMYDFSMLDQIDDSTLSAIAPNPSTINCGAGVAKLYVYPSGNVCSCTCFRDLPIGNLATDTLETIIQFYQPVQVKDASCHSCRYIALCKGGCLGSGYKHHGELGKADPRCPRTASLPRTIKMAIAH
jgi:radical SAM protein with 4Fe4S-binding SPASM domain